jgi:hypothetical protein
MINSVKILLILIVLVAASACNLSTQPPTAEPLEVPSDLPSSGKPVVQIASPESGDEVAVNTQIFVTANATDSVGVTRVQLIANNQVVKTISSESPAGQQNFQVLLDYTPRQAGDVNLQVVAYRGAIASDPAEVDITVRSTQSLATATLQPISGGPVIDPNDPTCRILTNVGLNLRTGPGTNYDRITVLSAGTVAPIIGRLGDNSWWQVRSGLTVGWVSAQFTSVYGICSAVPVVNPPPSPTPTGASPTPSTTATPTPTPTPTISPTPGKADLVISSIAGPTEVTLPSDAVTYAVTITNTGSGPSGQFANKFTLPGGTETDLGVVANLSPNESISLTILVSFSSSGTFSLTARADSSNQISEVSEVNNVGILSVTVTGP